jgi:hypothetical protein
VILLLAVPAWVYCNTVCRPEYWYLHHYYCSYLFNKLPNCLLPALLSADDDDDDDDSYVCWLTDVSRAVSLAER